MKQYDPKQLIITFANVPISGFDAGSFVKVARNEDTWTLSVGADGQSARTRNQNRSGIVVFTLQQSSPSNDVLSAFAVQDELLGVGVAPMLVKDLVGTSLYAAQNAWVKKPADTEFAKEFQSREWTIECSDLNVFVGGALG